MGISGVAGGIVPWDTRLQLNSWIQLEEKLRVCMLDRSLQVVCNRGEECVQALVLG